MTESKVLRFNRICIVMNILLILKNLIKGHNLRQMPSFLKTERLSGKFVTPLPTDKALPENAI